MVMKMSEDFSEFNVGELNIIWRREAFRLLMARKERKYPDCSIYSKQKAVVGENYKQVRLPFLIQFSFS